MIDNDSEILKLRREGQSIKAIGEKVGLTEVAILRRLKRMECYKSQPIPKPGDEAIQKRHTRLSFRAIEILERQRQVTHEQVARKKAEDLVKSYVKKVDQRDGNKKSYSRQILARLKNKQNPLEDRLLPSIRKGVLLGLLIVLSLYAVSSSLMDDLREYIFKATNQATASSSNVSMESKIVTPTPTLSDNTTAVGEPASSTTQEIRVIGNRVSKHYHLPGMRYYQLVEAHHRVDFSSEDEAIKAGYHKAPR